MPSQSEDDQQNKPDQSNQNHNHHMHNRNPSSDANNSNQPPPPPASHSHQHQPPAPPWPTNNQPPPHGYPPAMGYPPQMMYHNGGQYPVGYPPPPQGYNHHYPYVQAPPGAPFYNNQSYPIPQSDTCKKIARAFLAAIITIIALTLLSELLTYAILGEKYPVFYVDNMNISKFNTSTPFTGTWNTSLTVENPNQKLKVYIDRTMCTMRYGDENELASSWLDPILMNTKSNKTINAAISADGLAENAVPIWVTEEMSRDRDKGSVTFSLDIRSSGTLKYGSWYTSPREMAFLCQDLKVDFAGSSANGVLEPGKHPCRVYFYA